ncbi:MAG: hypothetical protein UT37_C0008G0026 [Parcubacteria group bacterium GW2011_GWA2_39_18]|nr:MAG: hypothetical protein UT37_C0008G0026 [Parcubacteria group bacterium GW2011_GWA2_39_18]
MKEKIKSLTKEFLDKMGFLSASVETSIKDDGFYINIMSGEGRILIGKNGANLLALERVLHVFLKQKLGNPIHFSIDVNNYCESHWRFLKNIAQEAVKKSLVTNKPVPLPPMLPKDRRLVHSELSIRPDVVTESKGVDPNRFIVVYPRP